MGRHLETVGWEGGPEGGHWAPAMRHTTQDMDRHSKQWGAGQLPECEGNAEAGTKGLGGGWAEEQHSGWARNVEPCGSVLLFKDICSLANMVQE